MPSENPKLCAEILALQHELQQINHKVDQLVEALSLHVASSQVRDEKISSLLEAWNAVTGASKFFKFIIPVLAGIGAFLVWAKNHFVFH